MDLALRRNNDQFESMRIAFAKSETKISDKGALEEIFSDADNGRQDLDTINTSEASINATCADSPMDRSELSALEYSTTNIIDRMITKISSSEDTRSSKKMSDQVDSMNRNSNHSTQECCVILKEVTEDRDRALAFAKMMAKKYTRAIDNLMKDYSWAQIHSKDATKLQNALTKVEKLKGLLAEAEAAKTSLSKERKRAENAQRQCKTEIEDLQMRLESATEEIALLKRDKEAQSAKTSRKLKAHLSKKDDEITEYQNRVEHLQKQVEDKDAKLDTLQSDCEEKFKAMQSKLIVAHNAREKELEESLHALEEKRCELETSADEMGKTLLEMQSQNRIQALELDKLNADLNLETKKTVKVLKEKETLQKACSQLEEQNKKLSRQAMDHVKAKSCATQELQRVESSLRQATREITTLQRTNENIRKILAKAEGELESSHSSWFHKRSTLQRRIAALEEKLAETSQQRTLALCVVDKMKTKVEKERNEVILHHQHEMSALRLMYEQKLVNLKSECDMELSRNVTSLNLENSRKLKEQREAIMQDAERKIKQMEDDCENRISELNKMNFQKLEVHRGALNEILNRKEARKISELKDELVDALEKTSRNEVVTLKAFYENQAEKQIAAVKKSFERKMVEARKEDVLVEIEEDAIESNITNEDVTMRLVHLGEENSRLRKAVKALCKAIRKQRKDPK